MKKRVIAAAFSLLTAVLLIMSSTFAYAINYDYLDIEKWRGNSNVKMSSISRSCTTGRGDFTLSGNYGYYVDDSSMTLYTYFDIDEQPSGGANNVYAHFDFQSATEAYTVEVDDGGMKDSTPRFETGTFTAASSVYSQKNTCIYAVQHTGKEARLTADVVLIVNGHKYIITEGITVEKPTTTTTAKTTRPSTTKKQSSKSSKSKSQTTKFTPKGNITTTKQSTKNKSYSNTTSKRADSKTTKVAGKSSKTNNNSNEITLEGEEGEVQTAIGGITLPKLIFIIIAIILATAGITLLITAAVVKSNKKKEKQAEEESEDEEEKTEAKKE